MKRTNTFDVTPRSDSDEQLLRTLLDASAALWNEINYERRERYADTDADVWEISDYREGLMTSSVRLRSSRSNGRMPKRGARSSHSNGQESQMAVLATGEIVRMDVSSGPISGTHPTRSSGGSTHG